MPTAPPAAGSPARPTASPPVYRASVAPLPPRVPDVDRREAALDRATVVQVPAEVAEVFHDKLGVDVTAVPVHRGAPVSSMAGALAAKAFARAGAVYLPDELGDLAGHDARAFLAHELVHATQQRILGSRLPAEDSAEGVELEAAAVATENWFRGTRSDPPVLVHRHHAPATAAPDALPLDLPFSDAAAGPAQRAAPHPMPNVADEFRRVVDEGGLGGEEHPAPPSFDPTPASHPRPDEPPGPAEPFPAAEAVRPEPVVRPNPAPPSAGALRRLDELASSVEALQRHVEESELNAHHPRALDVLAEKLYRHVRSRLRAELIIDRERSGRLSDLH